MSRLHDADLSSVVPCIPQKAAPENPAVLLSARWRGACNLRSAYSASQPPRPGVCNPCTPGRSRWVGGVFFPFAAPAPSNDETRNQKPEGIPNDECRKLPHDVRYSFVILISGFVIHSLRIQISA